MGLWMAVPESEDGSWFDEPIGANSEEEAHEIAQKTWAGKLPPGVEVMVYACHQMGQVVLPHASGEGRLVSPHGSGGIVLPKTPED